MADGRAYPARPIVGVGAVVLDDDRVLLVKRAHEPLEGEWSLPGGAVEIGETLEAAVAREALEETGLTIDVGPVVEVLDRIERDQRGAVSRHYVIVDYLCAVRRGTLACGSDAADARWAPVAELSPFRLTTIAASVIARAVAMRNTPARPAAR